MQDAPKKAFSIAEAMITLLIVSLAMAAMAPIMSKKAKTNLQPDGSIPPGAIMAFDRDNCPPGWTAIKDIYRDSEGAFIRNLEGNAKPKGIVQSDAVPNISGWFGMYGSVPDEKLFVKVLQEQIVEKIKSDGSGSTRNAMSFDASRVHESYGRDGTNEVRPKNIAFLYCRKN